jgi:hypothetical protein
VRLSKARQDKAAASSKQHGGGGGGWAGRFDIRLQPKSKLKPSLRHFVTYWRYFLLTIIRTI